MRYNKGENELKIAGHWERSSDLIRVTYTVVMESSLNQSVTWFS